LIGGSSSSSSRRFNIGSSCKVTTTTPTELQMGLFDFFGPKKSASASHILVKGKERNEFLINLKKEIEKSKDIKDSFAQAGT